MKQLPGNLVNTTVVLMIAFVLLLKAMTSAAEESTPPSLDALQLSNKGEYLFGILVHRKVIELHRKGELSGADDATKNSLFIKLSPDQASAEADDGDHELIKVYANGTYPDYDPGTAYDQDSLFLDDTFKGVFGNMNIQNNVAFSTSFDETLFLDISKQALVWIEQNTKLAVRLEAVESSSAEYSEIVLHVEHKPALEIDQTVFQISESATYASLESVGRVSRTSTRYTYRLGIPFGKHPVRVELTARNGEQAESDAIINNTFRVKPRLHLLAVGIDEFPNLPQQYRLQNGVKDAELVKRIFRENGSGLFDSQLIIQPYVLNYSQTTRSQIEKLVEEIRTQVRPNDYFVMYVASHGLINEGKYYFAPADLGYVFGPADLGADSIRNGFGEDQISEYLLNIPTIFRMAILDTCHAGREVEHVKDLLATVSTGKRLGISILSAAKTTQVAVDNYKGNGLFTYVLAQGLKGEADYNDDHIVDSMEIAQYVQETVGQVSRLETLSVQDAVVLPEPRTHIGRRFELTRLDTEAPPTFRPNIFTPRESELYIDAMRRKDTPLMDGIIRNNERHGLGTASFLSEAELTRENIIRILRLRKSLDINLQFDISSARLSPEELTKLETIASALSGPELAHTKLLVEGHTDSTGDANFNRILSQQRADTVRTLLQDDYGIAEERMITLGLGESYPLRGEVDEEALSKNRRVSIFIFDE